MSKDAESTGRLTEGMVRAAIARAASRPESAVQLIDFSSGGEGAAAKGEGYTTVMRAVTATARVAGGEKNTHHFMVKAVPANRVRALWLENAAMFEREVAVYFEIMPALRKLSGGIKVPRAYYGDAEEGVLVMEDLKRQGFSIQDKRNGQSDQ